MTVNQILNIKGTRVYSIPSTITVYEALKIKEFVKTIKINSSKSW